MDIRNLTETTFRHQDFNHISRSYGCAQREESALNNAKIIKIFILVEQRNVKHSFSPVNARGRKHATQMPASRNITSSYNSPLLDGKYDFSKVFVEFVFHDESFTVYSQPLHQIISGISALPTSCVFNTDNTGHATACCIHSIFIRNVRRQDFTKKGSAGTKFVVD